jgi:hypothetical protein
VRDALLLSPRYQEEWEDEIERLEREKELDHRSFRDGRIGSAHRNAFIEKLRARDAVKEYESLIATLGEKFRGQSIERLREVAEKRRIHVLTASQFREERAAEEAKAPKKPREYDGFPILPEFLVLPGQVQATKIDAAFLSGLVRADFYLYRRICSKYGMTQITDRQNGV